MPIYSAEQIIDKTLTTKRPLTFYRVFDINNQGDKAKPVSNKLPKGYSFVVFSYLEPTEPYVSNYGIMYAGRSNLYFTFKGRDGNSYAVKNERGAFDTESLKRQGVLTVDEEIKLREEQAKDPFEQLFEGFGGGFGKFGNFAKWIIIGVAAVWATGYIIKSTKK